MKTYAYLAFSAIAATASSQVTADQRLCVYDLLGSAGDVYNMAKDYVVAAKSMGASISLKGYTDERVASQDFIAGQCEALLATGLRTRPFNPTTGALDSMGVTTLIRGNKLDIEGSYEVFKRTVDTFSSPAAANLMIKGKYEVGGIFPFGTAYPVVNDRKINSVEALAGKRIASFDYDRAQAVMIQKVGAQPVSADITNFASKFNNGAVDFIVSPAAAYKPLELYRGVGSKGAVNRFPVLILSYQLILNKEAFPQGFGQKSREYWSKQNPRAMALIRKAEKDIPASAWDELSPQNMINYTLMLRESRITIAEQGIYDKQGLKIIKRVRCSLNAADAECSTNSENW